MFCGQMILNQYPINISELTWKNTISQIQLVRKVIIALFVELCENFSLLVAGFVSIGFIHLSWKIELLFCHYDRPSFETDRSIFRRTNNSLSDSSLKYLESEGY